MGCLGCRSAVRRGAPARGHTEECRRRFEEIFTRTGDARVRIMVDRISEEVREAVEGKAEAQREEVEVRDEAMQADDAEESGGVRMTW